MDFNFLSFFEACDPSRTLIIGKPEDRQYYIDFASVRGGKIIEALERTILLKARTNQPSCQLFTGHIGCGKSTELRRLQADLEQKGFHVVYFESTEDLDMADVDVTDILLAIIRQVSESLEKAGIRLRPSYFKGLLNELADILQTPIELSDVEFSLPMGLGKVTAQTKESPKLRSRLRQYLEPRTRSILEALNKEVLGLATERLKQQGKQGLVVIVDNLDRVDNRPVVGDRTQPEYLFVDRGEQLRQLNCHVVYTIPLVLIFSNEYQALTNRFGGGVSPKMLPMVPVQCRDGSEHLEGLNLLRQIVLTRAFPTVDPARRTELTPQIFENSETLDRLCRISGGHIRNLLGMLYRCLQEDDPPISSGCLERAIREHRDSLTLAISDEEWLLLNQVIQQQGVSGEAGHQTLLRSLFVFEYHDDQQGRWFNVNPVLRETEKFRKLQAQA
ncbi:MAG: ATP-binding protein [Stenomitos rutilans HA7619-LM2]|jgi:hypothetical protein|nr:ATP-binding protein [Stenomitos rutilans HA7619-LM2]